MNVARVIVEPVGIFIDEAGESWNALPLLVKRSGRRHALVRCLDAANGFTALAYFPQQLRGRLIAGVGQGCGQRECRPPSVYPWRTRNRAIAVHCRDGVGAKAPAGFEIELRSIDPVLATWRPA